MDEKTSSTIRATCVIGIILLLVIAACLVYPLVTDYLGKKKAERLQASIPTESDKEINYAKNTLYENGVVSILLANMDPASHWTFFLSNTGNYVVEIQGNIPDPDKFVKACSSDRVGYLGSDIKLLTSPFRGKILFRIQFVKDLGNTQESIYGKYSVRYSEYTIYKEDGSTITTSGYSLEMLDIMEAYLQDDSL